MKKTSTKTVEVTVTSVRRVEGTPRDNPRFILTTDKGEFKTDPNAGTSYYLRNDFLEGEALQQKAKLILTGGDRYKVADWRLIDTQ